MSFNYENYLIRELSVIKNQLDEGNAFMLLIANEQAFTKQKNFDPNTIYIIIKQLASSMEYNATTTPIQLLALCEQNNMEFTQELLTTFTETYNWKAHTESGTYIKEQYAKPVVLSNFNEVGYGYRSVLYVSGTILTMDNVLDIKDLKINSVDIQPLSFNISYGMSGNTQQLFGATTLAQTIGSVSTLSIGMTIPLVSNNVTTTILSIISGQTSKNTDFSMSFYVGSTSFFGLTGTTPNTLAFKLQSVSITTAPNQVPALQLAFIR